MNTPHNKEKRAPDALESDGAQDRRDDVFFSKDPETIKEALLRNTARVNRLYRQLRNAGMDDQADHVSKAVDHLSEAVRTLL